MTPKITQALEKKRKKEMLRTYLELSTLPLLKDNTQQNINNKNLRS